MRLLIPTLLAIGLSACASRPLAPDPATDQTTTRTVPDAVAGSEDARLTTDAGSHGSGQPAGTGATDVWQRIRAGLSFDRHLDDPTVREKLAFYARKQEFLDRVAERAHPYLFHIVEELERRGMPMELALLPIVESAFQPFAYSRSRASGIWQFIPSTGNRYGLKQNWWYDGRRDIVDATRAALDYLGMLHAEFDGDWLLALAAYNAGEKNVQRAVDQNRAAGRRTDFFALRLPRETRGYVPSLLAVCELLGNAERYGIRWQPIPNQQYFSVVHIDGQIEIDTAASLAGLSREAFRVLNPAFNQWATDPDGPHRLLVPVAAAADFAARVAALPPAERVRLQRHVVRNGDNLGLIARRYGTSVAALQQANHLRGTLIRVGQVLAVPTGPSTPAARIAPAAVASAPVTAESGATMHSVARGDTLWSIARRHGVSVAQLLAWNDLTARATLRPGQKIRVTATGAETAAGPEIVPVAYTPPAPRPASYTVRAGDSLWLISRRFGITVAQLQQWNRLQHGSVLHPGQTLIVSEPDADMQGV